MGEGQGDDGQRGREGGGWMGGEDGERGRMNRRG